MNDESNIKELLRFLYADKELVNFKMFIDPNGNYSIVIDNGTNSKEMSICKNAKTGNMTIKENSKFANLSNDIVVIINWVYANNIHRFLFYGKQDTMYITNKY